MYYIVYNNTTKNLKPEIDYGNGITMPFKIGYILLDTNLTNDYTLTTDFCVLNGVKYNLTNNQIFHNKNLAEIRYLQLQLIELKKSSFDFFMPKTFKSYQDRYNELTNLYPEYII